jgi:hypothetical protein
VILLERSNEWNLSLAKEGSSKKKRKKKKKERKQKEQGLKRKRGETSYEEARSFKRRRKKDDEIYKLLGEILSIERKEVIFSYSTKSDVWPHPYPHIICICTTFYSFTFPFLTPIHYTIIHQQ